MNSAMCRCHRPALSCCLRCSDTGHQIDQAGSDHVQRIRVIAAHHPLSGQVVTVVRQKRQGDEVYLVIEGPDQGRQLLPARYAAAVAAIPPTATARLMFTPGSLRALAELVATLRGAPSPVPEVCHAPQPAPAVPDHAALGRLSARDAPAPGRTLDRSAAATAPNRAGRCRAREIPS